MPHPTKHNLCTSVAHARIRQVQDSLLAMSEWAKESHASAEATELLLAPYRELIESLYESDLPLAKSIDESAATGTEDK